MGGRCDPPNPVQLRQNFGRRLPREIPNHPVVRQYGQLGGREQRRQKPVVFLIASMLRVGGLALLPRTPGAGGAMVSVGHVGVGHGAKRLDPGCRIGHPPYGVPDPVGGEVVEGGSVQYRLHERLDVALAPISQQDRLGVSV